MLKGTALHTRSLDLLLSLRGPGRSNHSAGGWSIFVKTSIDQSALDASLPMHSSKRKAEALEDDKENHVASSNISQNRTTSDTRDRKRRVLLASGRFGTSALPADSYGLERLDIRLDDPFPSPGTPKTNQQPCPPTMGPNSAGAQQSIHVKLKASEAASPEWRPEVRISFQGSHVFAGIRQMVENGVIDGDKMPGWLTGEAGVSIGVVRAGKIMSKRISAV